MADKDVGFIGLGLMGEAFTRRLIESGRGVIGFDIDAAKMKAAAVWGVNPAKSAAEVAKACDLILVCVINTAAVEEAALGAQGVAAAGRAGGRKEKSSSIIRRRNCRRRSGSLRSCESVAA